MKTPLKILIMAALAVAVIGAVALKKSKAPAESHTAAATPAATSVAGAKLPKLLDLGADKCIPCKAMAPILEALKKDFAGRFEVEFIDVWIKENAVRAKECGIKTIPTQIFFDASGKELFRHEGFFPKEEIVKVLKKKGV